MEHQRNSVELPSSPSWMLWLSPPPPQDAESSEEEFGWSDEEEEKFAVRSSSRFTLHNELINTYSLCLEVQVDCPVHVNAAFPAIEPLSTSFASNPFARHTLPQSSSFEH